ncbi:MAG: glucose-1-phosphate thymidylyltransferase [Candidatus Acetothermia bacterium]|nr:glucose-1-phosphate thymidylyltransferase [Candidatus Acetothermia bacterium]
MKAVVLCGGGGTRVRPFTYTLAKHLLPVAGRPVVAFALEAIREAGIADVGIVVSPSVEGQFRELFGDGERFGIEITYIVQPEPKGLAHAVLCAEGFVGEEPFHVYLGDNLLEHGVAGLVEQFREEKPAAAVALARVEDPRRFGVAVVEGGRLKRLVEKPADPPSNLAVVGAYAFDARVFQAARAVSPSFRGELELTDALQWLIDHGHRVLPYRIEGWWQDVGRPEDLLLANRLLLDRLSSRIEGEVDRATRIEGPVAVASGARVRGSRIVGPVVIGEGAVVEGAAMGPHVAIGPRAVVRDAEVADSILMDGARIEGVTGITGSVIGRNVIVDGQATGRKLFVGDEARISLGIEGGDGGAEGVLRRHREG